MPEVAWRRCISHPCFEQHHGAQKAKTPVNAASQRTRPPPHAPPSGRLRAHPTSRWRWNCLHAPSGAAGGFWCPPVIVPRQNSTLLLLDHGSVSSVARLQLWASRPWKCAGAKISEKQPRTRVTYDTHAVHGVSRH